LALDAAAENASVFQSDLPLETKLDRARTELLDLSARNRLLNMPKSSKNAKAIEIVDEKATEIFRLLVSEGRVFTFLAGKLAPGEAGADAGEDADEADEIADLAQPDEDADESGRFARHVDTRLQTRLTSKGLQKRLLDLYYDARTLEEEQGVNILYLALGALKWIDPQNAANIRYAPLILIPVSLERGNAGEKFKLRARPEDFASNLSLEAFLDRVHGIRLPAFEASEQFIYEAYAEAVAEAVSAKAGWAVLPDAITLGFFSFAKFLMYRDLDPANWPAGNRISERPLVRGLLSDGFEAGGDMIPEDARIDPFIPPADMLHIVDSDSSQALVIHEVRKGRDMVVQGPPGTGKSQTIANIVASAIADGRTVLFVAEKMAALEVVKRRLDANGVGDACLELHSNKANKRSLLEELRRTWELGAPRGQEAGTLIARLEEARDRLNGHAERMHALHGSSGLTPFQAVGQLVRLRLDGQQPNDIRLEDPVSWSRDGFIERRDVLAELVERVEAIGVPAEHPWRGVGRESLLPTDVDRLVTRVRATLERLADLRAEEAAIAESLEGAPGEKLADIDATSARALRVAGAPDIGREALASNTWTSSSAELTELLSSGRRHADLRTELAGKIRDAAWQLDLGEHTSALMSLPAAFAVEDFGNVRSLTGILPRLIEAASALSASLGRDAPRTLDDAERMALVADRVSKAPKASAEVFAADLWETGVERAADLASTMHRLEGARAQVGHALSDSAWEADLGPARATLASHGTGLFRFLSGDWRRANRLVRSFLSRPDQPLDETLQQLDALAEGQAARREIEREDALGRTAFGEHWRGPRSLSEPLQAIVEWMRSLTDLGAEPRLIASKRPDQRLLGEQAETLQELVRATEESIRRLWGSAGDSRSHAFGSAGAPGRANLDEMLAWCARIEAADRETAGACLETPADLPARLALLGQLASGQDAARDISGAVDLGSSAFGAAWVGEASDWDALGEAADWMRANEDIRVLASALPDPRSPAAAAAGLEAARDALCSELAAIASELSLDPVEAFGTRAIDEAPIATLLGRLEVWSVSGEQLSRWVAYRDRAARARILGCGDVVDRLSEGRLSGDGVVPAFEMAYYEAVYADMVRRDPELGRFDGTLHGRLAREFADMDRQRISAAAVEVVRAHHRRLPAREGGAVGPLGTLRAEMQKRRGHMPIRRLMEKAGLAIQALKPVFMMSPLSIAQFLAPGVFEFDLLVMDEASQIQPVDALGAVARARQVVVVGDPKQLPPTAFFAKVTGSGPEEDDDDGGRVADIESVLGLFTARGLPTRMLRWHYRSKHQSLIAVSNRQFYESKLFIVPSPFTAEAGMGLRFHRIPQGVFDAGGTRTNQIEARIVAEAIVAHAREHPELSLGVAAFSAAQRRAIVDQLEVIRRALPPEVESFFQAHHAEPFFVKNLENVQGDERDVIFISVGYGPTVPGGRVPMRFGPLGSEGGERRLNVLISRAKQRCEVFSSMTDEDIDPDFAASRKGVFAFRMFLHYARTGRLTIAESTGRDHDSVFEEQVARALQARGYQVHRQVGLAGFYIDLAVADEERPGRYLLGIECDGASYHDSRSARDRDRLRQSVLESHGWTIHRIWSTDWFQRPTEQLELVIARIEAAKAEHDAAQAGRSVRAVHVELVTIDRENVTEISLVRPEDTVPSPSNGYSEAVVIRPPHCMEELHEAPTGLLSVLADHVVQTEGPVHLDEIVARIREGWGLKRAGGRIQSAIARAVDVSVRMGRLERDGDFLSVPGQTPTVRDRSGARSPNLRRPDMLPPAEIRVAAVATVRDNFGATADQVVQSVSRTLGIKLTSGQLRTVILTVIGQALAAGELVQQGEMLSVPGQ
jgi:very-short-patch-repair endonuclease